MNNTLTTCPDCGQTISHSAKTCPHCGKPIVREGGKLASFLCGLIFGPIGCIVAYFSYKDKGVKFSLLGFVTQIILIKIIASIIG